MSNIIDKLGIKNLEKIPCINIKPSESCNYTAVNYELLRKKEIEYNDLLEAVIQIKIILNKIPNETLYIKAVAHILNAERLASAIAELITGKSWEEIQELIK